MVYESQSKPCRCGKIMILVLTGAVLTSEPPQIPQQWWCGGCNRLETGPTLRIKTQKQNDMEKWEKAQRFYSECDVQI